jgi:hypothetical protein
MGNIKVGRYPDPNAVGGWAGWIEDDSRSWIMFIDTEGRPLVFLNRDPVTGGVIAIRGGEVAPDGARRDQ